MEITEINSSTDTLQCTKMGLEQLSLSPHDTAKSLFYLIWMWKQQKHLSKEGMRPFCISTLCGLNQSISTLQCTKMGLEQLHCISISTLHCISISTLQCTKMGLEQLSLSPHDTAKSLFYLIWMWKQQKHLSKEGMRPFCISTLCGLNQSIKNIFSILQNLRENQYQAILQQHNPRKPKNKIKFNFASISGNNTNGYGDSYGGRFKKKTTEI